MKPYYQEAGITIYHGDCREILPHLPTVDLVLTDPPYGVSWRSTSKQLELTRIEGDGDQDVATEGLRMACGLLRRKRHVYAFGKFNLSGLGLKGVCELIWDKGIPGRPLSDPWMSQHDYISFGVAVRTERSGEGNGPARMRRGSVLHFARINGDAVDRHPTEKPIDLLRELIESSSRMGETVLDPFMGSGSTLVAARIEGRRAIGIEIEEQYCELAAKRLSQGVIGFDNCGITVDEPAKQNQEDSRV